VNSKNLFDIFTFFFSLQRRYRSQSRDSSLGLVTGCGLYGREIGVRFLAGSRGSFLLHSFQTGSGTYLALYTMGTGGLFPQNKALVGMKLTVHLHQVPRSRMVELYLRRLLRLYDVCVIS
jgi:hypothetical protein